MSDFLSAWFTERKAKGAAPPPGRGERGRTSWLSEIAEVIAKPEPANPPSSKDPVVIGLEITVAHLRSEVASLRAQIAANRLA